MESSAKTYAVPDELFRGYQMEFSSGGESALSWQLSNGLTWRKKIWPRLTCPSSMHRWNTVEEILSYLLSFEAHKDWISTKVPVKPPSGTILFFDRTKTKNYRNDGYDWKTRKSNASIREDRMKLKVCGMQLLYGCYTHCASIPNLHRRSYWLIQDPDIIMVHYLEVDSDSICTDPLLIPSCTNDLVLQDECELRRSFTPASWAYLTISDKNLCSILSRSNTALEIRTLTTQLRLTLDQNLPKATNLDHAVAMNNSGLPFDWVKEVQLKKQRLRVVPKESGENSSFNHEGSPSRFINIGGANRVGGSSSEKIKDNQILKALSSSPNIIVCCPQNGVSYILLNNNSIAGELGKNDREEGSVGEGGGRRCNETQLPVGLKANESGQPLGLEAEKGCCGPKGKAKMESDVHEGDYDLSNFTRFASRLVDVDPLQGFGSLEGVHVPNSKVPPTISSSSTPTSKPSFSLDTYPHTLTKPTASFEAPPIHRVNCCPNQQTNREAESILQKENMPAKSMNSLPGSVADSEMYDLSLNLDPECLKDLFKVPLSPEGVENHEGGETYEMAMEEKSSLSPLSQLMQSFPLSSWQHHGNAESVYIDVHGTHSSLHKACDADEQSQFSNFTTSQNTPLSVFPSVEASPVVQEAYQWEDLLQQPNGYAPPSTSEEFDSHTTNSQSQSINTQAISNSQSINTSLHTPSSNSTPPNSYLPQPHSPLSSTNNMMGQLDQFHYLLGLDPNTNSFLDSQLLGTPSVTVPSLQEQLYPQPIDPASSAPLLPDGGNNGSQIFTGGTVFRPLQGSSTFLSPAMSQPPMQKPSSPILSISDIPASLSSIDSQSYPNINPRSLTNIPKGVPMNLENTLLDPLQGATNNLMDPSASFPIPSSYRTKSPTPSSPSIGSVSGHSTVSSLFDPGGESPSVLELCELLSESPNVQQYDFVNMTFTDTEQKQLFKAIQIIQNAFRKFKTQWQHLPRVEDRQKHAALLIENYYTRYRQLKQHRDKAARRIQHNYRMYRSRSREMNRAALFIQQMYRFHRIRKQHPEMSTTSNTSPLQYMATTNSNISHTHQ